MHHKHKHRLKLAIALQALLACSAVHADTFSWTSFTRTILTGTNLDSLSNNGEGPTMNGHTTFFATYTWSPLSDTLSTTSELQYDPAKQSVSLDTPNTSTNPILYVASRNVLLVRPLEPNGAYAFGNNPTDTNATFTETFTTTGATVTDNPPPIPEADEWAMLMLGLPLTLWMVRRKKGASRLQVQFVPA